MLHQQLLKRLCTARKLLRQVEPGSPSVQAVAQRLGFSPSHFIRLYKAVFGVTPNQCRIDARLRKARTLLLTTSDSVTTICLAVGCDSLGSFTTQFTREVGLSPRSFRQTYRPRQKRTDHLPPELIPGCFALMPGGANRSATFEK